MIKQFSYWIIPVYKNLDNISVLLIQHHDWHRWFPKWHIEDWETPIQTAIRECQEEVGIFEFEDISQDIILDYYTFGVGSKIINKTVWYFIWYTKTKQVHIQQDEIKDYARVEPSQVDKYLNKNYSILKIFEDKIIKLL